MKTDKKKFEESTKKNRIKHERYDIYMNRQRIENRVKKLIKSPVFKNYCERAKEDEYVRLNSAPSFGIKHPNTGKLTSYSVQLSQDYKSVKVIEHGIYDHELGFFPLGEENKSRAKRVTKRATTRKTSPTKKQNTSKK